MPIPVKITRLSDGFPLPYQLMINTNREWMSIKSGKRQKGYECYYKGTREQAIHALETVLAVMQYMPEQPIEEDAPTNRGES